VTRIAAHAAPRIEFSDRRDALMNQTIAFLGDVMLGRGVSELIGKRPRHSFWGTTLPLLGHAGAVIANLECAITGSKRRWQRTAKVFHFGAVPEAVDVLHAGKIRCVGLANNHTLDYEEEGLIETLQCLDAGEILHAGAGLDRAAAEAPALLDVAGTKIGFVSMTDNEPAFAAGEQTPGTNFVEIDTRPETLARLSRASRACRAAGADLAVLSLHWGPNMVTEPPPIFRAFAHEAIDRGFNIIHGHSAHPFQGVEIYNGCPILYDTGDFLDDYAVDEELHNDWSFIFLVDLEDRHVERVRLVPVQLSYGRVDLATESGRELICSMMTERCAAVGTTPDRVNGALAFEVAAAAAV
jgi:poly-gamma-glutamate synthesis protein (capsule biosynthesis protein)